MIYERRQPEFSVWECDSEHDYLVGFVYGWDEAARYQRMGYLVEML